jgi:hypothetical protein
MARRAAGNDEGRLAEAAHLVKSPATRKKVIASPLPGLYRPRKSAPFGARLKLFFDRSLMFEKSKNQSAVRRN